MQFTGTMHALIFIDLSITSLRIWIDSVNETLLNLTDPTSILLEYGNTLIINTCDIRT